MNFGFVLIAVLALSVAATIVVLYRNRDFDITMADVPRFKWYMASIAAWAIGFGILVEGASQICAIDFSQYRRGLLSAFMECSPRLLSGAPVDVLLFIWAWAGSLLIPLAIPFLFLRSARRASRNSQGA